MFGLSVDTLRCIKKLFSKFPKIQKVILYGSRAKGNYEKGSDIDITLIGKGLTLDNSIYPLMKELDELYLPYKFDISILNQLENTDLIDHILRVGKTFYQKKSNVKDGTTRGWQTHTLGDLCKIEIGGTPARQNPKFWDIDKATDNVWLSIADLPKTLKAYVSESKEHISDEATFKARLVRKGTLLVSFKLTLGRLAFANRDLYTNEAIASLIILKDQIIMKNYLYWYLTYFDWNKAAEGEEKIKGKTLNKKKLNALPVILPSLPEQERIVTILDEAFAAIAVATTNTEKNLANVQIFFESELTHTFSHNKDKWVEKHLGEMSLDFGRGKSKHRPRNASFLYGGDYPFVQTGDIRSSEHIISNYIQSYSEAGLSQSKLWPAGTVCITIAANIAETGILGFDACFPDSVIGMVPDSEKTSGGYVEYLLQFFKKELQRQGKGSAQNNINLGIFKRQKFPFTSLPEQQAITAKLDALYEQTNTLKRIQQSKLTVLTELKQSLLHMAFTGELTVDTKVADRTLSKASV